ncbi:MAG TPA: alpha-ketoglutarate-dependent dioxygenase AlkB [Rhodospirillaceae bacterium]|nr:alpha-ketoglutarate-dependent dioxygenase AlkB [Rhodospirillaceae bacterium]
MDSQNNLFDSLLPPPDLPDGMFYRQKALVGNEDALYAALSAILAVAPPAQARTRGGGLTSAAITNCGHFGWWSDAKGYRYQARRPDNGKPWPPIPNIFFDTVERVMSDTPWPDFKPDSCLINFYGAGAKMGLHQDRDEKDLSQPILTICLGDDAIFMVGGFSRTDKATSFVVSSGDVLIMGGASRMRFHGIRKVYSGTGSLENLSGRYSLTFRKAF